MEDRSMKVWITKWALTQGIFEAEVEECDTEGMVAQKPDGGGLCNMATYYHGEGKEWHRTRESAVARAEAMRQKKIANVKKQLKKLELLKFE